MYGSYGYFNEKEVIDYATRRISYRFWQTPSHEISNEIMKKRILIVFLQSYKERSLTVPIQMESAGDY